MPKSLPSAAFLLLLVALRAVEPATDYSGPVEAGRLAEPRNLEQSGLAVSTRTPGLLWTHNDSGGQPILFALGSDGELRGTIQVAGVANRDWEEVAAFQLDGRAWLMAAEIGDNYAKHPQSMLHVLAEPDAAQLNPAQPLKLTPDYTIHFTYEDGPRDCEALAVDTRERVVYLLSKRDRPTRLYRLPLAAAPAGQAAVARFVGTVWDFPQPDGMQRLSPLPAVSLQGMPTAMNFLPGGSGILVLTYGGVYLFPRTLGESWADTLAHEPRLLPGFLLPQAESIATTPDGAEIYLTSERTPQLLRYEHRK
jgi:hypothetical protein